MIRRRDPNFLLALACAVLATFGLGCGSREGNSSEAGGESRAGKPAPGASTEAGPAPIQHVPVGKFTSGSLPGEPGRRPEKEPLAREIELGPFRIDTTPFAENGRPKLGATRAEAEATCATRGGRLCTELEWERACKGPTSTPYPSGAAPCPEKGPCVSGFDVQAMGSLPEWTASSLVESGKERSIVRGATASMPSAARGCARRSTEDEVAAAEIGFRCCYGAPNAARLGEPTLGDAYREIDLPLDELVKLLGAHEKTRALASQTIYFKNPEGARTVLERGDGNTMGFTLTTRALEWQPARGTKLLVVAGRSGEKTSFVVAYHVTADRKLLAGSFVMKNEPGPIALAYAQSIRPRVHFSSCWGCPGETGKLLFREPEDLVLLQP